MALAGAAVIPGWRIYFPAHSHGSWLHSESSYFIKSSTYVQLGSSVGFLPESWRSKGLFSACTVLSPSVQESKYDSFKNSVGFLGNLLGVHTIRLKPHPQISLNKVLLYFLFPLWLLQDDDVKHPRGLMFDWQDLRDAPSLCTESFPWLNSLLRYHLWLRSSQTITVTPSTLPSGHAIFPTKAICWSSNLHHDAIWRWGLWVVTRLRWGREDEGVMMGLVSL